MKTKPGRTLLCLLAAALFAVFSADAQPVVSQIAAGGGQDIYGNVLGGHSLFIKSDGSLWAMGNNQYGQLGDGTTQNQNRPEMIEASGVTAIAAGQYHSLFIMNGSLWAMGNNQYGQLGDGSTTDSHVPEVITSGVTAISAGYGHSLFIKKRQAGTITELWGMGYNNDGELGDGTAVNHAAPVKIKSYSSIIGGFLVTAIAAGGYHSLLIKGDGTLWAMGLNYYGELGDQSVNNSYVPEQVYTNNPVTAIAAGGYHSMFLAGDNYLWTMGDNTYGQLGTSNYNNANIPIQVATIHLTAIAAGGFHSLFLTDEGPGAFQNSSLTGKMGDNTYGQTGLFSNNPDIPYWIYFPGALTWDVRSVAAGGAHSLFLVDGQLWGLGDNEFGQLGSANYINTVGLPYPQFIATLPPPQLDINSYSNQPVLIFTPSATNNYVLQMTTNLASGVWVTASNYVPINAWLFTNAPANAFFRIH